MSAGLPTEGTNARQPHLADVVRRDVPTCSLGERIGDVRNRAAAALWEACVVIGDERVVLGLLRAAELRADADLLVEQVMAAGPEHLPAIRQRQRDASHDDRARPGELAGDNL